MLQFVHTKDLDTSQFPVKNFFQCKYVARVAFGKIESLTWCETLEFFLFVNSIPTEPQGLNNSDF